MAEIHSRLQKYNQIIFGGISSPQILIAGPSANVQNIIPHSHQGCCIDSLKIFFLELS